MDLKEIELKKLEINKNLMEKAAKALNFTDATIYRDNLKLIKEILNKKILINYFLKLMANHHHLNPQQLL